MVKSFTSLFILWAHSIILVTASPLAGEIKGDSTLYKRPHSSLHPLNMRDDNAFAEPFLANKSSIHDQASEPKDNPQGDLRPSDDISPFDKIPRAFIETKCDAGKNLRSETPGRRLSW